MEPLDFLAAVLPSPEYGRYCVAEFTSRKEQVFTNTLEETQSAVARMLKNKDCVYFAMSTFGQENNRTAANAQYVKSMFIDMDGYASKKDAAHALNAFLENTGLGVLGVPWIVNSGGGLHCYWPLKEAIPVDTWKPVAENFKRLCKQEDMAIDMTVTADAARVLRVPGTINFKK